MANLEAYWKAFLDDDFSKPIKPGGFKMETFETGAKRDSQEDKPVRFSEWHLELWDPDFLHAVGHVLEEGAKKYGRHNWQKGMPISRAIDSAFRHLFAIWNGDDSEDHAANLTCNAMFIRNYLRRIKTGELPHELDDRKINKPAKDITSKCTKGSFGWALDEMRKGNLASSFSLPALVLRTNSAGNIQCLVRKYESRGRIEQIWVNYIVSLADRDRKDWVVYRG